MAFVTETGTITFPATNDTVQVNLSNFDASNPPKAIIFFGEPSTSASGAARQTVTWCLGFSDGTTEGCTLGKSRDNLATTDTTRHQRFDAAMVAAAVTSSHSVVGIGRVTDIGDDYFDVTFSDISGGGQVYSWVALGGSDLEAEVVNYKEPEDDETDPKFISLGFTPTALITTSGGVFSDTAEPPEDRGFPTSLRASQSFSVAADRYCVAFGDLDNQSSQQMTSYTENVSGISNTHSGQSTTTNARMTATPDTNGFNITLTNETNSSVGSYGHTTLALAGTVIELHERTSPTTAITEDIVTGVEVGAVLAIGNGIPKGSSATAFGRTFFGAFDGTDTVCRGAGGTDIADPTNSFSWWVDDALIETWVSGSTQSLSASVSVVDTDTVRLTWSAVESTGRSFALLVFGPDSGGSPGDSMVTSMTNDRPDWPSLVNPLALTELPTYPDNLATDNPQADETGLTLVDEYRFSGVDQSSDTRRPQGVCVKDGIIISQFQFQPSSPHEGKQKLILIDPAQGSIGRQVNVVLVEVNPATNKFERILTTCGGIGVIGNYLYTASNVAPRSIRVFDLREFYEISDNSSAVESTDTFIALYDIFLPQVGQIFVNPPLGAGISYLGTTADQFVAGNFYDPPNGFTSGGKAMVWQMEVLVDAMEAEFPYPGDFVQYEPLFPDGPDVGTTITRIQGAIIKDDVLVLSRSWSSLTYSLIALHVDEPDTFFFCGSEADPKTFDDKNWLFGCEQICIGDDPDTFLTITEFVTKRNVSFYALDELLALVGGPDLGVTINVSNTFTWANEAEHNYVFRACSNALAFADFSGFDQELSITQYLGLTTRHFENAQNNFGWNSFAGAVYEFTAENSLGLVAETYPLYLASNQFGWSQLLFGSLVFDCENVMGLSDIADSSPSEYGREGVQRCIRQHVTYTIQGKKCIEKEYAPLIGESGDESYAAMPVNPPVLTTGTLTLTYPAVTPTATLVLKNPNFGNQDAVTLTVIDRMTRGGDRIIFGDPKWATSEVLSLTLEHVCTPDVDELIEFLNNSLGQDIGLLDWEGRQWTGVMIAPQTRIAFASSGYRVELQFQGGLA